MQKLLGLGFLVEENNGAVLAPYGDLTLQIGVPSVG
jgi:hypothetical protein